MKAFPHGYLENGTAFTSSTRYRTSGDRYNDIAIYAVRKSRQNKITTNEK